MGLAVLNITGICKLNMLWISHSLGKLVQCPLLEVVFLNVLYYGLAESGLSSAVISISTVMALLGVPVAHSMANRNACKYLYKDK